MDVQKVHLCCRVHPTLPRKLTIIITIVTMICLPAILFLETVSFPFFFYYVVSFLMKRGLMMQRPNNLDLLVAS